MASRLAQVAEFVEVANRVDGVEAARELARERRGEQFDPAVSDLIEAEDTTRPIGAAVPILRRKSLRGGCHLLRYTPIQRAGALQSIHYDGTLRIERQSPTSITATATRGRFIGA